MAKLEEVILRGARSAQPTAGTGSGEAPAGTIMYITDEGINERVKDDHSQWESWGGVGTAYASNSNAVAAAGAGGAATNVSRADHVHLGTTSISHASNTYSGPVILVPQGIVGITSPSSGTFAINAVASAGGGGGSGSGYSEGTSFPVSPSTNDKFYRTDRNLLYYYDGTRWLTTTLNIIAMTYGDLTKWPEATGGVTSRTSLLHSDHAIYVEKFYSSTYVTTTNDGTKFWTVTLVSDPGNTTLGSFTTASDSADTHTGHAVTINTALAGTVRVLNASVTKTSTPGAIYAPTTVTYRLIG